MTALPPQAHEPRRAPELRLPYPLLEYLVQLKGDYAKIVLRLLQRAQWRAGSTQSGVRLDAGEVLLSLRSRDLWGAVQLDRDVDEAGRVSLLRRVLRRLEQDGLVTVHAAHETGTRNDTGTGTRRDTPATVVRFLKYRDSLWPANTDATHGTAREPAHDAPRPIGTIPSREDPASLASQGEPRSVRLSSSPRIDEVRTVLAMAASAFEQVVGASYQHAPEQAQRADTRAAAKLLAVAGDLLTIEEVWRWALRQPEWPRIETLADLAQHWVRLAPRALRARGTSRAPETADGCAAPGSQCSEWKVLTRCLSERLRPDLFERWFAPLTAIVHEGELELIAPDDFHRDFLEDTYRAFLTEELSRAALELRPSAEPFRLRISSRDHLNTEQVLP